MGNLKATIIATLDTYPLIPYVCMYVYSICLYVCICMYVCMYVCKCATSDVQYIYK